MVNSRGIWKASGSKGRRARIKGKGDSRMRGLRILICTGLAALFVFPIAWTIRCSFLSGEAIEEQFGKLLSRAAVPGEGQGLLPTGALSLEQYRILLLDSADYLLRFWNSVILVVPIVVMQLIFACMTAFGFYKARGRLAAVLFFGYLILLLLPYQVTVIPNYIAAKRMGLLDTNWSIWLPGAFSPFSVYLLTRYMKRISPGILEAAQMDGAGLRVQLFHIILPVCRSVIAVCGVLVFIDYWNMVELPLVMFSDAMSYPLSVFLSRLQEESTGGCFAAAVVYMAPALAVFLCGERELEEFLTVT